MKIKNISKEITTASNAILTAKAIFGLDALSLTEKEAILYVLNLRAAKTQVPRADFRQAIEKLEASLKPASRFSPIKNGRGEVKGFIEVFPTRVGTWVSIPEVSRFKDAEGNLK